MQRRINVQHKTEVTKLMPKCQSTSIPTHSLAKSWNVHVALAGNSDFRVRGGGAPSSMPQWTYIRMLTNVTFKSCVEPARKWAAIECVAAKSTTRMSSGH